MTPARIALLPISIRNASAFVRDVHRHSLPPRGAMFAVACALEIEVRGVAIVGRPVARALQDGFTAEVTRLATDGTANACSMLYRAAWRAVRALGYRRLVTYTLASEPGTSLRAAGFTKAAQVARKSWSTPSRPRTDKHDLVPRIRWELRAAQTSPEETGKLP